MTSGPTCLAYCEQHPIFARFLIPKDIRIAPVIPFRSLTHRCRQHKVGRFAPGVEVGAIRIEHDLLGDRAVPAGAYYGIHTLRALENFPISGTPIAIYPDLVTALACIKQAAAIANSELGLLDERRATAIRLACDLSGRSPQLLVNAHIAVTDGVLVLSAADGYADVLLGEQTRRRGKALAEALGLKLDIRNGA